MPTNVSNAPAELSSKPRSRLSERLLRAASPRLASAADILGGRLIHQGRFAEAEQVLACAVASFPRSAGLRRHYALAAQCDGRFAEAAERWAALCALRPRRALAWAGLAACRRVLGDISGARAAITEALALAPDETNVFGEAARIFDGAGEPERSVPLWARLVETPDASAETWQAYVEALLQLERVGEAEAVLRRGLALHPEHRNLVAASGSLAIRRDDWESAVDVWSRYAALYPDDPMAEFHRERAATILQLQRAQKLQPMPLLAPIAVERVEDPAIRDLLLGFEGIGSDCEFGSVQRRYNAEPLGLLRWNDVTFSNLAAALEAGFAGMGEPDVTMLDVGGINEVYVRDKRWDLGMHTFMFAHEVSMDALLPKMCRRLVYLRDKFLDDLAAGDKILVFKTDALSMEQLKRLHTLFKSYGPTRLLHVRHVAWAGLQGWPSAAAGEIVAVGPDLLVGYLSRMSDLRNRPDEEWLAICRAAAAASSRGAHDRIEPVLLEPADERAPAAE